MLMVSVSIIRNCCPNY